MQKEEKRIVYTPTTAGPKANLLFFSCLIIYFLFSATRNFWPQALAQLVPEGIFRKDVAGMVTSAHMISYGIGMFVNGFLSEKVKPFLYIAASLGISTAANAAIFLLAYGDSRSIALYMTVWAIAGFSQSATWPTMIRLVSALMPEEKRTSSGANLYAASCAGTIGAYLISQQVLRMFSWKELFITSTIIGVCMFVMWCYTSIRLSGSCVKTVTVTVSETDTDKNATDRSENSMIKLLLMSGGFTIIFSMAFKSLAYDGFVGWSSTMISELYGLDASMGVMLATLIPIFSFLGVFMGRLIFHRITHSEVLSAAIYMILGSIGFTVIAWLGTRSLTVLLVALILTVPIVSASATMYVSLVPLRFARYGRAGTAAGLFNSIACGASGTSSLMIGILSQNFGWQTTVFVLAVLLLVGGIFSVFTIRRFNRFKDM